MAATIFDGLLTTFDRPQLGPAGQLAEDIRKVWNPWDNWLLMRWGALGYVPAASAALPELTALTAPVAQGMEAPCSIHTHDTAAIKALGELDILAGLLSELLAQALEQVEALELEKAGSPV